MIKQLRQRPKEGMLKKTALYLFIKSYLISDFTIDLTDCQIKSVIDLCKNVDDYIFDDNFKIEKFIIDLIRLCIFKLI